MNWLTYLVARHLYRGSSKYNATIEVVEAFGDRKLLVNGITQTGAYPHALFTQGIQKLSRWQIGRIQNILVFGIGGGDIFKLLHLKYPNAQITGVDIDEEIIRVAKQYFHIEDIARTSFIVSDAKKFAKASKTNKHLYDSVIVDIYIGNTVPEFVTMSQFLKDIRHLLRDKGSVMFNYFSYNDQTEKKWKFNKILQSIFSEVSMESNHKNIFFYCRR